MGLCSERVGRGSRVIETWFPRLPKPTLGPVENKSGSWMVVGVGLNTENISPVRPPTPTVGPIGGRMGVWGSAQGGQNIDRMCSQGVPKPALGPVGCRIGVSD